jgi:hypothetical protein
MSQVRILPCPPCLFLAELLTPNLDEVLERPVIGLLGILGKQTSRKFLVFPVIVYTVATIALSGAAWV